MIQALIQEIVQFRDDRDWAQFHNGKDLSICLAVEAAELQEVFLWKDPEEVDRERLKEELADVLICSLLLVEKYQLDFPTIIRDKLALNAQKYPVEKAKGSAKKYTEL
ncbi:MAG: nucleotide pyrophosphohydrolase [Bacteroidota bacterium]